MAQCGHFTTKGTSHTITTGHQDGKIQTADVPIIAANVPMQLFLINRANGLEASIRAANPNVRLFIYDKAMTVWGTFASNIPEAWLQHSGPLANDATDVGRRIINVAGGLIADPTVITGSLAVADGNHTYTATNWADWNKQHLLGALQDNPQYDGIHQDLNSLGAFTNNTHVAPVDCSWSAGGSTITSPSAPFNASVVGRSITLFAVDGATKVTWNKVGGGTTTSGTVLSISGDRKTATIDNTISTPSVSGSNQIVHVPCSMWSNTHNAALTEAQFWSEVWGPYNNAVTSFITAANTPAYYVFNNTAIDGDTFESDIKVNNSNWMNYSDFIQCEHWMRGDNEPFQLPNEVADATHQGFLNNLKMCLDYQNNGTVVNIMNRMIDPTTPGAWTAAQYATYRQFCVAAYMICNRGKLYFNTQRGDTDSLVTESTLQVYTTALGAPIDSSYTANDYKVKTATGAFASAGSPIFCSTSGHSYFRRFANGAVVVCLNEESGSQTFTLDRTYTDYYTGASYGTSLTLAPGTFATMATTSTGGGGGSQAITALSSGSNLRLMAHQ